MSPIVPRAALAVRALVLAGLVAAASSVVAASTITFSGSLGGPLPVSAEVTFATAGTTLTMTLRNTSPTPTTLHPEQVLTSFYFDLLDGDGSRVGLTPVAATGEVFKIVGGGNPAEPYVYAPPSSPGGPSFTPYVAPPLVASDILVKGKGDDSWMYKSGFDTTLVPFGFYGVGTVGNSSLAPNSFPAKYVNQIEFGIFAGSGADPKGLLEVRLPYLVKDYATFTFTADRNLDAFEFTDPYAWGFGTNPDQMIILTPEPSGTATLGAGAVAAAVIAVVRRRRTTRRQAQDSSSRT